MELEMKMDNARDAIVTAVEDLHYAERALQPIHFDLGGLYGESFHITTKEAAKEFYLKAKALLDGAVEEKSAVPSSVIRALAAIVEAARDEATNQ